MKKKEKILLQESLHLNISTYDIGNIKFTDGAVDNIIRLLKEKNQIHEQAYGKALDLSKYEYFTLDIETDGSYSSTTHVFGWRFESDEEFNTRIENDKKANKAAADRKKLLDKQKEEKDRQEYERLKQKYEGKQLK